MTHSSQRPKRVWAYKSSALCTHRASTENAAFTGLTNWGVGQIVGHRTTVGRIQPGEL